MPRVPVAFSVGLLCLGIASSGRNIAAQAPAPELPRVAMCTPLAVPPGAKSKVIVRGWKLADVSEVRCSLPGVSVQLLGKGAAAIPQRQEAKQVGDTQVELEITLPPDAAAGSLSLVFVGPTGESAPHALLLGGAFPVIAEKEDNGGFRQAQPIILPQIIDGQIENPRNVDVFQFDLVKAGTISCEILARRHGSALDAILTLYDATRTTVAVNDDQAGASDSRLSLSLPAGKYYLAVQDAHDQGGPAHPYRLVVTTEK